MKAGVAAIARRRELPKGWTSNIGLKLFSLAAAVLLFSLVHGEEEAERSFSVDVMALLPPPETGKMLIGDWPDQVRITLRGSRSQINALNRDNLGPVQMELVDTENRYFHFENSDIEVPAGVQIVRIEPPAVKLTWADRSEKMLPVKTRMTGAPRKGLSVKYPVQIVPSKVKVVGSQATLAGISAIYTDLVSLDGLERGKHEKRVPLEPLPENVEYDKDKSVDVRIELVPEVGERKFSRLELVSLGQGEVIFRPPRVTVTLKGPLYLINEIEPEDIVPYVDPKGLTTAAGTQSRKVVLRGVPDSVEVARILPAEVLVKLR